MTTNLPTAWGKALGHYPWEARSWFYNVLRGNEVSPIFLYGERSSGKTFFVRMLELVTVVRAIPTGAWNDGILDAVVLYAEGVEVQGYLDRTITINRKGKAPLRVPNKALIIEGNTIEDCPTGALPVRLKGLGGKSIDQWDLLKDLRAETMELLTELWDV